MTKAEIRARIAAQKKTVQGLEAPSAAAVKNLQYLAAFQSARTVGAYMPLPGEVDISPLFACPEKIFFIPAFDESSGLYRMARLAGELKTGRFGIREPAVPVFAEEHDLDLIIVPGVAFDRAGQRIGRGGGFYDRLLPQYRAIRTGICFDFQCLEVIPAEDHDVRMDFTVTESKILKFAMNS
ncbi:MAG TPA: 5-formyltetrahydrofolate cyclo-ligase [Pontiellaceae bacterium]|nr:5-formyltetrahydrofolate cyclo-ligase [Pontiellaceae bacterium]HPR82331.1 5-formyltetrahydrofolate cyclo-ligase [Pontiellaceae bacterium]